MAMKSMGTGLDLLKLGILKDFLINPLTTAARTTLGGTLGAANEGLIVWDMDLNALYVWSGSTWLTGTSAQTGLTPKGNVAFNAAEPGSPVVGDLYVFSSAGTNTWEGSTVVQVGDQVYWDGTVWQFIQRNLEAASETIPGYIEIATSAETTGGTDDTRAVTPLKLKTAIDARSTPKTYFNSTVTTVANTPFNVAHNLALQNRDAYVWSFKVANSEYGCDMDSIDVNNCSITTNAAVTGALTIIGF